jgi:hypothetical protein
VYLSSGIKAEAEITKLTDEIYNLGFSSDFVDQRLDDAREVASYNNSYDTPYKYN